MEYHEGKKNIMLSHPPPPLPPGSKTDYTERNDKNVNEIHSRKLAADETNSCQPDKFELEGIESGSDIFVLPNIAYDQKQDK